MSSCMAHCTKHHVTHVTCGTQQARQAEEHSLTRKLSMLDKLSRLYTAPRQSSHQQSVAQGSVRSTLDWPCNRPLRRWCPPGQLRLRTAAAAATISMLDYSPQPILTSRNISVPRRTANKSCHFYRHHTWCLLLMLLALLDNLLCSWLPWQWPAVVQMVLRAVVLAYSGWCPRTTPSQPG